MTLREKLVSNATFLSLNWIATSIIPIAFWFVIGKTLPPEAYGIVATSLQVAIFLSFIASFGFPTALDKLIPEFLKKGEKDKVQGLINHTTKVTIVLIIGITIASLVFSQQISGLLNLDVAIFLVIIALFVANTAGNYFKNIYFGYQNMKKIFSTSFIGQVLRVIVTVGLIYMGFSYFGALGGLLVSFLAIFITRFDMKIYHISKKVTVDRKMIYAYALPNLAYLILVQLYGNTQNIILTSMTTATISGFFGIAMTISAIIDTIPQVVMSAIFPAMSALCGAKDAIKRQHYLLKLMFRYSLVIIIPIALAILMFSENIVILVSSAEYMPATELLVYLIPAVIIISIGHLFFSSLYAIGEPRKQTYGWAVVTAVYAPLVFIMTYLFSATGLSIAYLISAIVLFAISFFYVRRSMGFSMPFGDMGRMLVASIVLFAILFLFKPALGLLAFGSVLQYALIACVVAVSLCAYLLVLLKTNFFIEEDLDAMETLAKKVPFLKRLIMKARSVLANHVSRTYK